MATATIKTPEQLIALFAERAVRCETVYTPAQMEHMPFDAQVRLTVKQVNWLVDLFRRVGDDEFARAACGLHGAGGSLPDGRSYDLKIMRNGAGILNLKDAGRF